MRKMITLLLIALVSAIFAMCTPKNEIPVESNWAVDKLYVEGNEISVPEGHSPYLAFLKDSKISGETGCNRFFGDYKAKEGEENDRDQAADGTGNTGAGAVIDLIVGCLLWIIDPAHALLAIEGVDGSFYSTLCPAGGASRDGLFEGGLSDTELHGTPPNQRIVLVKATALPMMLTVFISSHQSTRGLYWGFSGSREMWSG